MNKPNTTENILWMAEEQSFDVRPELQSAASANLRTLLESAAGPDLNHWLYRAWR